VKTSDQPVSVAGDQVHVMGNHQHRTLPLLVEAFGQLGQLVSSAMILGRGRLIHNQHFGGKCQRGCNSQLAPVAEGKAEGKQVSLLAQSHQLQHFLDSLFHFFRRHAYVAQPEANLVVTGGGE